jgi:hypothetical protein
MPYRRCVPPPVYVRGAGKKHELRSSSHRCQSPARRAIAPRFFSGERATELREVVRNTFVVLKPVCTPVPLAKNGGAAGSAGFAPPASALSKLATRFPVASGIKLLQRIRMRTSNVLQSGRKHRRPQIPVSNVSLSIRRTVPSKPSPRSVRKRFPSAEAVPGLECRLVPDDCLAPKRVLRDRSSVSRPGFWVNSHTLARTAGLHTRRGRPPLSLASHQDRECRPPHPEASF